MTPTPKSLRKKTERTAIRLYKAGDEAGLNLLLENLDEPERRRIMELARAEGKR